MRRLVEFDIFYISYDEPNAEENWADLLLKAPWAKRIHGVKGFDAAHKEAAKQSTTDRFVTVDGDNVILADILDYELKEEYFKYKVFSFSSKNYINGLVYGNGGVKLWDKEYVLNMKSHEESEKESAKVDFCWEDEYKQFDKLSSVNYQNGSAYQSFRAGFREGVKMCLDQGIRVRPEKFMKTVIKANRSRLQIWGSIGNDVLHGKESIYGTRLGAYMTMCSDWDYSLIRNYDWFEEFWKEHENWTQEDLQILAQKLKDWAGLEFCDFTSDQSKFFKSVYVNPSREFVWVL